MLTLWDVAGYDHGQDDRRNQNPLSGILVAKRWYFGRIIVVFLWGCDRGLFLLKLRDAFQTRQNQFFLMTPKSTHCPLSIRPSPQS